MIMDNRQMILLEVAKGGDESHELIIFLRKVPHFNIIYCQTVVSMAGWLAEWMAEWMDGWMDRWTDGWIDE
uniref:Uncharacterized protein n=1 Tax=Glossina morsitans morsitans TaxID=37546 RepID=A0A1B0FJF7_GLOMM